MRSRVKNDLPILLIALVSVSALVSLPQVESAWNGVKEVYGEQDFGLRILRKAMLVSLASQRGAQESFSMDGRISGGGRLVWKTPRSSLSASCETHGSDRRKGTGLRWNIRLEKDLPVLLFALVSASTLASLPQVESAWSGVKEVYGEQDFGLRILREVILVVLVAYLIFEPRLRSGALTSPVMAFLGVVSTYVLLEVGYALYLDLPLVVPMAGLRVFEYLPLALIGFVTSRLGAGEYVIYRFAHYLRYYIALQAVLAIAQALWAPPLFGVSFLGGGRPFGTFVSPNLFGATMATCALLFALVPGMRKWVAVSVFLALLSGSRTAFISSLLVVYFQIYAVSYVPAIAGL